jgi:transposase InsO family protein
MHRIVEIEFFKPDPNTGTLGYVYHKWNRSNPWQVLGLLNMEIFTTLKEAKVLIEQWKQEYNHIRPHSALGYRPPAPEVKMIGALT